MADLSVDLSAVSGHVYLREGKRRSVWYAKWRDRDGQHQKRLGIDWSGKGRPPSGLLRKRDAEALLDEILVDARRGQLRQKRTGLTFADVAEDWYARGPFERNWSASTQIDYRSVLDAHLLRAFGQRPIESITAKEIERWRDKLAKDGERSRKTINKILTQAHAIFQHAVEHFGLLVNVVSSVKRLRESSGVARFDFYTPDEIDLIAATAAQGAHRDPSRPAVSDVERELQAAEDQQDAAIYLTAALTGLRRSELLALLWEDVDFEQSLIRVWEGYSAKTKGKPKSRKSRTVPMVEKVAKVLEQLKERGNHAGKDDLVFVSREGTALDGSALRRRYVATLEAAKLRQLRFHDLRHTFGSLAINVASIVQVSLASSLESRAVRQYLSKPALKTVLNNTSWRIAIVILVSALLVATSASAAFSSTGDTRSTVAASGDRAATQALLEADYRLAKAVLVHFGATEAALARAAKTLGRECKGVLRGAPDESVLEEEGPSASRPRLSGRARGELARSELEKQTIDAEIRERFSAVTDRVLRRPYEAYVHTLANLVWSNPTINAVLQERTAKLRKDIAGHTVAVCPDMRAWAASGFHVLPPASKRLEEARQARNQPPVQGNLYSLLQPYEGAVAQKIRQRTAAVDERLRKRERNDETYARADYQMKRELGEKVSSFQRQQFAPVIARGRTSAGTTFVIRANVGKGRSHSCKHEVNIEVTERDGSGSGGGVCIGKRAHSQPSSDCSGSVETLELATSPDVHSVRFRLGDGHTVTAPVVQIPARYGGPAGVLIDSFRGYGRHPVSLQELSANGKIIRTVDLKRTRCTKQSMSEGPGPPQFVTLTTTTTPTGEPLVIQATLMHFRGQTEFSLGPSPGTRSFEISEEHDTSKQFQWNVSTECEPHRYTLIDGILTSPVASVLVRIPTGLVVLTKVELAASINAPGPLFYGVYTAPPTEIVVERSDGSILYTESLAAKATEETEYCEGYAEQ